MKRIHENAYYTCDADAALGLYLVCIGANSAEMTDYECRREAEYLLQKIAKWQPRYLLLDIQDFPFLTIPQTFAKFHADWHATLSTTAVQKFALILGNNSTSVLIRKTLKASPDEEMGYQKALFTSREEGMAWLVESSGD